MTKQKSKLEDLLTGINPFNAKKPGGGNLQDSGYLYSQRREDGHAAAEIWRSLHENSIRKQKAETKNAELEESLASAQKVSTLKQIEDLKLRRDYDSAVAILEQIPAEVLNIYAQSSHRGKERPIEQSL